MDPLERQRQQKREAAARYRAKNPGRVKAQQASWKEANPTYYKDRLDQTWASRLLSRCRGSAKARGQECSLTMAEILDLFKDMRCAVTGIELRLKWEGSSRYNPWAPSLDRIDQSKGYVPGNVRPVCWAFNCARQDWPDEVVLAWASSFVQANGSSASGSKSSATSA